MRPEQAKHPSLAGLSPRPNRHIQGSRGKAKTRYAFQVEAKVHISTHHDRGLKQVSKLNFRYRGFVGDALAPVRNGTSIDLKHLSSGLVEDGAV